MADNVGIVTGTGATVATDEVSGAQVQLVKLVDGTADSGARIPGHATKGLAVEIMAGNVALSGTGTVLLSSNPGLSGTAIVTPASGIGISGTAIVTPASGIGISGSVTVNPVGISGTALVSVVPGVSISGTAIITPASGIGISGSVTVNPVGISGTALVSVVPGVSISGTALVSVVPGVSISGSATVIVAGDTAAAAADAGKPVKIGGVARITNPTAVTDAQRVNATFDDVGRQLVRLGQPRDLISFHHTAVAVTAETTGHPLGGSGVFLDLGEIVMTNAGSAAVTVTIKDSFAGQTALIIELAAVGGIAHSFSRPIPQRSANQAWSITLDTAVTVYSTMLFEKNV